MTREIPVWTVDSFTSSPFSGNPAGVCLLDNHDEVNDDTKQKIAAEMNISETCFVVPVDQEDFSHASLFSLRWFTPTDEVPLCGHGTLATATVLWQEKKNVNSVIRFETLSGILTAKYEDGQVVMDLPLYPGESCKEGEFSALVEVLSCGFPVKDVLLSSPMKYLMVVLEDEVTRRELEACMPDIGAMPSLERSGRVKGVILTVNGDSDFDFYSRHFDPWQGVPEDPVTGSTHTVMAPYWGKRLGRERMRARQCSRRGGEMELVMRRDQGRLEIRGNATLVMSGHLLL